MEPLPTTICSFGDTTDFGIYCTYYIGAGLYRALYGFQAKPRIVS
jgi:hypothetical protein